MYKNSAAYRNTLRYSYYVYGVRESYGAKLNELVVLTLPILTPNPPICPLLLDKRDAALDKVRKILALKHTV